MGTYPDATAVFDVDSIGLTNIANNLNQGLDLGGNPMGSQTALLIGVGANPGALNIDEELRRLEWKVRSGRGIYRHAADLRSGFARAFLARTADLKLPVIAGIWPLTSFRNAEFMVNELRVPGSGCLIWSACGARKAPRRAQAEGVAIAQGNGGAGSGHGGRGPAECAFRAVPAGHRSRRSHRVASGLMNGRTRELDDALATRILIMDGAMGTMLQEHNPTAADFGGEALENCNENLVQNSPRLDS